MKTLNEIKAIPSPYRGSEATAERVREELRRRYGDKVAKEYSPYFSCRSFRQWSKINYRVKKGEKAIKTITVIEETDDAGKVKTYPKVVNLFHLKQVERVKA